jgi:hypothetical protein
MKVFRYRFRERAQSLRALDRSHEVSAVALELTPCLNWARDSRQSSRRMRATAPLARLFYEEYEIEYKDEYEYEQEYEYDR